MAKNWFNRSLPIPKIHHAFHDLSNDYKASINMGYLIPTYVEETLPSDKYTNISSEIFLRFAPMKFPIMHRIKVRNNYFAVPIRLILGDDLYKKFHNGQVNLVSMYLVNDSSAIVIDQFKNTLFDYLGWQPPSTLAVGASWEIPNPIAWLSVLLVWRTWYADEVLHATECQNIDALIDQYRNAVENLSYTSISAVSGTSLFNMLPVCYTKDYFTAAQIEPQRGGDVFLMNPVSLTAVNYPSLLQTGSPRFDSTTGDLLLPVNNTQGYDTARTTDTIRDLWQKEQLQRYEDISALYGDRTNEYLAGHFGVVSSDARLQMPQFIGGGEQIVQISEVIQTSETNTNPLGSMAGKGTSFGRTKSYKYFAEEHMFVIGLLSIVPDNGYMTGNPRYFYKQNILDFAAPEFNNIGYQAVYKGEIFASGNVTTDKGEFGYQPRYSEYRQHRSIAVGDFRDATLRAWHLNRSFAALPPLNANFIEVNQSDSARIFNNTNPLDQHIYIDVYNKVGMYRPVSYMPSSLHL